MAMQDYQHAVDKLEGLVVSRLFELTKMNQSGLDILEKFWAQAAEHEAATVYFKIQPAREEIEHLNIETRRLQTYIHDEEMFLQSALGRLSEDPFTTHQLSKRLHHLKAINQVHCGCIFQIHSLPGFSGVSTCGLEKNTMDESRGENTGEWLDESESEEEDSSGSEADEVVNEVLDAAINILETLSIE
ncbi:hypothetical protein M422DRAFT_46314 [Sphaerobolus stellatus SS14]|uniref:Uncharacterized protein n=1 Tax=Sphaerobolus stellatus (strain SS14) TaxID=990650 RepID=A0A0C9UT10_SPHS4|nr:hypothetical protein M422DRAFT_46314 [Sphaerobolus stellatus SS14]